MPKGDHFWLFLFSHSNPFVYISKRSLSFVELWAKGRGVPEPFSVEGKVKQGTAPTQLQTTPDMKQRIEGDSI